MTNLGKVSSILAQENAEHIVVAAIVRTPDEIKAALETLDAPAHKFRWRAKDSVPLVAEYYETYKRMHSQAAIQRARKLHDTEFRVGIVELYRMLPVDGMDREALIYALSKIDTAGHEDFMRERKALDLDKIRVSR